MVACRIRSVAVSIDLSLSAGRMDMTEPDSIRKRVYFLHHDSGFSFPLSGSVVVAGSLVNAVGHRVAVVVGWFVAAASG